MKNKTLLLRFCMGTLLLGVLTLFSTNAWAQPPTWDAPTYYGEVPTSGNAYYIYNVGVEGFLTVGADYNQHATVAPKPRLNQSAVIVSWTMDNSTGKWTFQRTQDGNPIANQYIFSTTWEGVGHLFCDNNPDNPTNENIHFNMVETDAVNHHFTIQNEDTWGGYVADQFVGTTADAIEYRAGYSNRVDYDITSADDYIKWIFISQANYDLYQAKAKLDRYMNYAMVVGGVDLTSYISVYNSDVTAAINAAAVNLKAELGPIDVTSSITNPSFESGFTGWTNGLPFYTQGNNPNGTGMSKDGSTYAERWTGSVGYLPNGSITQTVTGLTNGFYNLEISGHAVQQAGANPMHSGAYVFCGTDSTEVTVGDNYVVDIVEVTDGSLTFGYTLEGTTYVNWTGFDNFRLYYYPPAASNASLSSITLSEGNLTPGFDSGTTSYYIILPNGTTSVDVDATTVKTTSTILSGTGSIPVTDGVGSTDIVVESADGTTKTYTLFFKIPELMHSYTFETDLSDVIGDADGTAVGGASVSGGALVLDANGEYVTFSGASLNLNSYDAITTEYFFQASTTANTAWTWTSYFGGNGGSNAFYTALSHWGREMRTTYSGQEIVRRDVYHNDGSLHHIVSILTKDSLLLYRDGVRYDQRAISGGFTIDQAQNYLGKGSDAWGGDPTWQGLIYEFNIYDGIMHPDSIAAHAAALIESDANLASLTVSTGTLTPDFEKSTLHYVVEIPQGTASVNISATPLVLGATVSGEGNVDVSGGSTSADVTVTSVNGQFTKTYTVDFVIEDPNCYTQSYDDLVNLIDDPEITDDSYYGGWGNSSIVYGLEAYCGISAGKIDGSELCWPNGGSLDTKAIDWLPNTTYLVRAKVKTYGTFNMGAANIYGDADGNLSGQDLLVPDTKGEWRTFEATFTTNAYPGSGVVYFNNCGSANGMKAYIDNWELYDIESDNTELISLTSPQGKITPDVMPGRDAYNLKYSLGVVTDSIVEINAVPRFESAVVKGTGEYRVDGSALLVKITVRSRSGKLGSYWVQVEPNFDDVSLTSLTASTGFLKPDFDSETTEYQLIVPSGTGSVDISAETGDPEASLTGIGTYTLVNDSATAEVIVASRDSTNFRTYLLNIVATDSYYTLTHSYTFEDGTYNLSTVFDQVGTLNGTIGGNKIIIADGKATVSGATSNSDGWISLDGAKLALNKYSEISIEAFLETGNTRNTGYTMLAYFGTSTPGNGCFWIQPTRGATETRVETNNGTTTINAIKSGYEVDDGLIHHLVAVLTSDELIYYLDGEVLAEASTQGADFISTIGTDVANIFRGVNGWNDPNYNVSLHEFNIYEGALDADTIAQRANEFLGQRDASLASLTVDAGKMSPTFDAGKTSYFVTIPAGATSINVEAVPSNANATVVGTGAVDVSSGSAMATVEVTSEDGSIHKTYTIEFKPAVELSLRHSYTFEDGTAADVIGDLDGNLNGSKISIADGKCTVSGATTPTDGYISLDAAKLALNTYDAITVEAYIESFNNANTSYTMLCYFGNNTGGSKSFWFQPTISGTGSRVAVDNTNPKAEYAVEVDDGNLHHVVAILTLDVLKYYLDGELIAETTTGGNYISTIDNVVANIFKGPDGWGDPNYNCSLDEFNIYNGEMDADSVAERANDYLALSNSELSALTVDGTSVPGFDPGTLSYDVEVADVAGAVVAAVAKYESSTVEITQASAIPGTATVVVTSGDSSSTSTYTINFMQEPTSVDDVTDDYLDNPGFNIECNYLAGADSINLATDNTGASSMEITGWSMGEGTEWRASATFECGYTGMLNGGMIPSLDSEGESGEEKGVLGIQASWGGHVTYYQEVTLPAGTYILKNMTYNSSATTQAGSSLFGWVPNEGSMILSSKASFASGVWEKDSVQFILTEETTGKIQVGVQAIGAGSGDNAKVFFDYVKLYKTNANSFVVDTESMSLDDVDNTTAVFNITGSGSDFEDVTFTVPTGLSLSVDGVEVTTISGADVTADGGVDVTVTFDGSANILDGEIVIMSGSLSESVSVVASADMLCFEPLFTDRENLISHPFMNSLDSYTGWGNRTIYTGEDAYCGASCYYADGQEVCWPNGASLDYAITGMKSDTWYRLKFMVKTVDGSFTINTNGWYVNGEQENVMEINTGGEWAVFDTTLQTGTLTGGQNLYFNNCEGATGMKAYLDNYELYEVDAPTSAIDWKEASIRVYPTYSSGDFKVETSGSRGMITVYNLTGKLVLQKEIENNLETITVRDRGMYLLKVENQETLRTFKVFKTR
ncbi:LamG-like jellyroll fold domain-containing protein [Maribellus mangrovi]|uniref:LamG-like jellyroll fold domain-containing protein n=1 Tax=Maribellus mangrovi TaxID=3133146 RepID=UPI0030EF06B6